jgi:hypothetical protein
MDERLHPGELPDSRQLLCDSTDTESLGGTGSVNLDPDAPDPGDGRSKNRVRSKTIGHHLGKPPRDGRILSALGKGQLQKAKVKLGQESVVVEVRFTGAEFVHLMELARQREVPEDGLLRGLAHMLAYTESGVPLGHPYGVKLVPTKPVYFGGRFWKRVRDIALTLTESSQTSTMPSATCLTTSLESEPLDPITSPTIGTGQTNDSGSGE